MKSFKKGVFALFFCAFFVSCGGAKEAQKTIHPLDTNSKGDQTVLPNEIDPDKVDNWFTKGPAEGVEGVDAERFYEKGTYTKPANDIVVAVIDSGVDIQHEDLRGKIWNNEKELNGKPGVDDDGNGYVDDFHGWNYIGGYDENGKAVSIEFERLEVTRELARLRKLKEQTGGLSQEEQSLFDRLSETVESARMEADSFKTQTENFLKQLKDLYPKVAELIAVPFEALTIEDLKKPKTSDEVQTKALASMIKVLEISAAKSVARLQMRVENANTDLNYYYNEAFDPRAKIVKDDVNNYTYTGYGNNDVRGLAADHGTHVSGIITASRDNALGIAGIATDVKIMSLRAVPDGDERDKDVALAVRYAVDNGAKIINMSFGKGLSPGKSKVDEAFLYAASKDVLIVHAAGNSAQNNDHSDNFPNRYVKNQQDGFLEISTWIEVGASSRYNDGKLTANFSNYGQNSVDIFAPGHQLNSTTPDNTYAVFSGTSMAAPSVTGVLALLWSQQPGSSGSEVRSLLLQNARPHSTLSVLLPGSLNKYVPFGTLSRTGGVARVFY